MRASEFGSQPLIRNIGVGGRRKLTDGYNRALKGSERAPDADEFAMKDMEEYPRYSEYKEATRLRNEEDEYEQSEQERNKKAKKDRSAKEKERFRSNLLKQALGMVVGGTIIVTSYQAVSAEQAAKAEEPETPAVVTEEPVTKPDKPDEPAEVTVIATTWTWNEEDGTASVVLLDSAGGETTLEATVTYEDETFCTKPGKRTYTATATDENGEEYTDSREEELPPTGHSYVETVTDGASSWSCSVCGEKNLERITEQHTPET